MKYTDETPMPFGKHKGVKLANVPASYLLFMYESKYLKAPLLDYVEENKEVLEQQAKKEKIAANKWQGRLRRYQEL